MNAKPANNLKAVIFRIGPIGLGLLMIFLVAGGAALALRQSGMFAIQAIPLEWRERLDRGKMEVQIAKTIEADIGVRFGNIMGKRPYRGTQSYFEMRKRRRSAGKRKASTINGSPLWRV